MFIILQRYPDSRLPWEILMPVLGPDQKKVDRVKGGPVQSWPVNSGYLSAPKVRQVTMITILVVTALLGTAVISRVESCNIGGFKYIPPPPPPCQPCQRDSSGKLARIFLDKIFFKKKCCEDTTTITKGIWSLGYRLQSLELQMFK